MTNFGIALYLCAPEPYQQEIPESAGEGGVNGTNGGATNGKEGEG
jgi:hypothetical protein